MVDAASDYVQLVNDLKAKPEARTLVLFLADEDARLLFAEMINQRVGPSAFQIIGSDIWGTDRDYILGMESQALGKNH